MYSSLYNPDVQVRQLYVHCNTSQLPMGIGFLIIAAGINEICWSRDTPCIWITGWRIEPHRIPIAVTTDHEFFFHHFQQALKKAHEHIATLHGNSLKDVRGFDLFA